MEDFDSQPCDRYRQFFKEEEINLFKAFEIVNGMIPGYDLAWAINHSQKLQQKELLKLVLKKFISKKPQASGIFYLMHFCKLAQTPEMRKAFWDSKPDAMYIYYALAENLIMRTEKVENLFLQAKKEYVKELLAENPSAWEILQRLIHFPVTQIPEILIGFLKAKPTAKEIYDLVHDFEFARTPEIMAEFVRLNPNKKFPY